MRDSNGHNEVKKGAENTVEKTMQRDMKDVEKYLDLARTLHRIYKELRIHPTDYRTVDEYITAVFSRTATEILTDWPDLENQKDIETFVKNELKKRGEI